MFSKAFFVVVALALCVAGKQDDKVVKNEDCNNQSATVTSWLMNKWNDCKNVAGQPAAAALWNDLKITYNLNPFAQFGFNSIERTLDAVKNKQSWVPLLDGVSCENKIGDFEFYGTPMTEKEDISVVSLYDRNGVVAGLQAWFLQDDLLRKNPPYKFGESKMFREATLNGKKYFVLTAYFIRPSQICNRGRQPSDLDDEGTGKGLWFQIGDTPREMHSLMEIPVKRDDAISKGWTKNSCFYAMGHHNFYKVDEWDKTQCSDFFPAFLLFDNSDNLIGFGFIAPGSTGSEKFEHPSSTSIKYILDKAPDCIMKQADHGGFSTLHVYFTSTPRLIMCPFW